ncbi:MAG: hypothetical protein EZS28_011026 [Streblomastix strix]|uniref:Uncharacterized protein n=1 Tax=Streblomastix strix TaxID=222440 RepID=A0A5J4WEV8_9EUKA|nr:MAG: hypothetical protein EZS28_011026 [Streblomastix strix]
METQHKFQIEQEEKAKLTQKLKDEEEKNVSEERRRISAENKEIINRELMEKSQKEAKLFESERNEQINRRFEAEKELSHLKDELNRFWTTSDQYKKEKEEIEHKLKETEKLLRQTTQQRDFEQKRANDESKMKEIMQNKKIQAEKELKTELEEKEKSEILNKELNERISQLEREKLQIQHNLQLNGDNLDVEKKNMTKEQEKTKLGEEQRKKFEQEKIQMKQEFDRILKENVRLKQIIGSERTNEEQRFVDESNRIVSNEKKQMEIRLKNLEELKRNTEERLRIVELKLRETEQEKRIAEEKRIKAEQKIIELEQEKEQERDYVKVNEREYKQIQEDQEQEYAQVQTQVQTIDYESNLLVSLIPWNRIVKDLRQPLSRNERENNLVLFKIQKICELLRQIFKDQEDNTGRKLMIEQGIAESLLIIFQSFPLEKITKLNIQAFYDLTYPSNNENILLLCSKQPYPGLIRLLDHFNQAVVSNAIALIFNFLSATAIAQSSGILKIYTLFKQSNEDIETKNISAICIGYMYKCREIIDQNMKKEIIAFLKSLVYDNDQWTQKEARNALRYLGMNAGNNTEIKKGGFAIPT